MEQSLFYATAGLLALVAVFWIGNLLVLGRRQRPSLWLSRGVYICGILCAVCSGVRSVLVYQQYKGMFVLAHIIVLGCILTAFVRWESGRDSSDEKDGEGQNCRSDGKI